MVAPPMVAPPMATARAPPITATVTRLATVLLPPLLAADSGENATDKLGYSYTYICSGTVTDSATARATAIMDTSKLGPGGL